MTEYTIIGLFDNKGGWASVDPLNNNFFTMENGNSWTIYNIPVDLFHELPFWTFNIKKVVKICFIFYFKSATTVNDFIRLDGIYFSDFCDYYYGEPGEDDLYAEVGVGRACVNTLSDVENFISKTISYMNIDSNDDYLKHVTMAGEYLGFHVPLDDGGYFMDDLIGKCHKYGYTTQGFPDKLNIIKLYDMDWPGFNINDPFNTGWPKSEIISQINQNVHIINHLGHSYYDYNMKMSSSDVYSLTNDKYCFIYSQGCMAGGFDDPCGYDCMAEYLTVKTSHGAFAGIWNARYGIGPNNNLICRKFGSTDSISERYHREFWDAVFGENITVISKANQDSKEDNIWRINSDCMRFVFYELNLFGDPAVQFKYLDGSLTNTQSSQSQQSQSSQSSSSSSSSGSSSSSSSTQSGSTTMQSTTTTTTTSKSTSLPTSK